MVFALCPAAAQALPQNSREAAVHPLTARTRVSRSIQYGLASWYGPGLCGRRTASGSVYDDRDLTAAHRSLPLGTTVRVTNLKNGRSVMLLVTDRGPWVRTRLIDVSRAAAERLGFKHRGLAHVKVTVLSRPRRARPSTKIVAQNQ